MFCCSYVRIISYYAHLHAAFSLHELCSKLMRWIIFAVLGRFKHDVSRTGGLHAALSLLRGGTVVLSGDVSRTGGLQTRTWLS